MVKFPKSTYNRVDDSEYDPSIDRKGKTFMATIGIRIRIIFQFSIFLQTAVYIAERFVMQ